MSESAAKGALTALIKELSDACSDPHNDSEISYYIGYAWYFMPASSPERVTCTELWLRESIGLDNENWYAWLYLGHLYFDENRYAEAYGAFTKIPPLTFSAVDQLWRDLQLVELRITCAMQDDCGVHPRHLIKDLRDLLNQSQSIDRVPPVQLLGPMRSWLQSADHDHRALAKELVELLSSYEWTAEFDDQLRSLARLPTEGAK